MKFSFSDDFCQPTYALLLRGIGKTLERSRILSGCNVKGMMSDLHISHPLLKRF